MLLNFTHNPAPFPENISFRIAYLIFTYLELFILLQAFLDSDLAVRKHSEAKCAQNVNENTIMLVLCLPVDVAAFSAIDPR